MNNALSYSSIYCLKTFGAFFVICIHSYSMFIEWPISLIWPIIRTAVPIFFIITGFFIFNENKEKFIAHCKRSINKIFSLTVFANIFYYLSFYFPYNPLPFRSLNAILNLVFIGDNFAGHLWYLNALIEALFLIWLALKIPFLQKFIFLIPVFFIMGLLFGSYNFLMPSLPSNLALERNCFTVTLPCLLIGMTIKKYRNTILLNFKHTTIWLFVLLFLSYIEVIQLSNLNILLSIHGEERAFGDLIVTTLPLAAIFMTYAIKIPKFGQGSIFEIIGKKFSNGIYIYHVLVLKGLSLILIVNNIFTFVVKPIICFVLTLIFVVLWEFLIKKQFIPQSLSYLKRNPN